MRLWGPRDAFIWYALVRFLLVRLIGRCRPHPPRPTPPGSSAGVGAHLQVLVHLHAARCLESTWRCLESESTWFGESTWFDALWCSLAGGVGVLLLVVFSCWWCLQQYAPALCSRHESPCSQRCSSVDGVAERRVDGVADDADDALGPEEVWYGRVVGGQDNGGASREGPQCRPANMGDFLVRLYETMACIWSITWVTSL